MVYWKLLGVSVMDVAAYPARLWGYLLIRLASLIVFMMIWNLIYTDVPLIQGYTFEEMFTYYVLAILITELTLVWRVVEQFSEFIHTGQLSVWLLKPMNITGALVATSFGFRLVRAMIPITVFGVALAVGSKLLVSTSSWGWFGLSLLLSIILAQFLYGLVGLAAFWVIQMNGIKQVFARVTEVFAGTLFPLDLLPSGILQITKLLPFSYIHYVPISIYLQRVDGEEMIQLIELQCMWVLICIVLYILVWKFGIRKYDSVGI